jgi:NTE family protein
MISPRLGKVGLFEFHRAKEAIELGEQAAHKTVPEITEALSILTSGAR